MLGEGQRIAVRILEPGDATARRRNPDGRALLRHEGIALELDAGLPEFRDGRSDFRRLPSQDGVVRGREFLELEDPDHQTTVSNDKREVILSLEFQAEKIDVKSPSARSIDGGDEANQGEGFEHGPVIKEIGCGGKAERKRSCQVEMVSLSRREVMGARIIILLHEADDYDGNSYLIRILGEIWRKQGHEIMAHRGPSLPPRGDLAVLHINLTKIPEDYLHCARNYSRVLNLAVTDISKKAIARHRVRRGDGYGGPVMLKANLNYGGAPEARLARRGPFHRRLIKRLRGKLPWYLRAELKDYPVFSSPREIPAGAWLNPDLVVERFLPERENGLYCLRTYMFLGKAETNSVSFSHEPQVKSTNLVGRRNVEEVPEELRTLRRELGFDFGKFDYVLVDGKVVLYDANRTPTMGGISPDLIRARMEILARGLDDLL